MRQIVLKTNHNFFHVGPADRLARWRSLMVETPPKGFSICSRSISYRLMMNPSGFETAVTNNKFLCVLVTLFIIEKVE